METEPFPHVVVDDCLNPEWVEEAANTIPSADWDGWVRYDSPCEQKRTTRDIWTLSHALQRILWYLSGQEWLRRLEAITGESGLCPDPLLHGGGVHVTDPGGFLDTHIDYALHPVLDMQRTVNCVLFLNTLDSGELCLFDDTASDAVKRIAPKQNRMVIWKPSDVAYHGQPEPLEGTESRASIATYYLTPKTDRTTPRKRALFVPRRS